MVLGNLLGFGGGANNASGISSSGKSGLLGKSGSSSSAKKVIRSIDFKKQEFKDKIRNTAPIKAWHKERIKTNGRMRTKVVRDVIAKNKVEHISRTDGKRNINVDYDDNIVKVIKGSVRSGQTVSSWKDNFRKKNALTTSSKDGKKVTYHIRENKMNREKRDEISKIFDPEGLTREEKIALFKRKKVAKRRNIYGSMQSDLEAKRRMENRNDPRAALKKNKGKSTDLGVKGVEGSTSVGGKGEISGDVVRKSPNPSFESDEDTNPSFAQGGEEAASVASGIGAKPQEDDDNVIDANFNKDKESF